MLELVHRLSYGISYLGWLVALPLMAYIGLIYWVDGVVIAAEYNTGRALNLIPVALSAAIGGSIVAAVTHR